jgi:exonuclease III
MDIKLIPMYDIMQPADGGVPTVNHLVEDNNGRDSINLYSYPNCTYVDREELVSYLKECSNKFTILSLNCQSLKAKFNEIALLIDYVHSQGARLSAICLQETWLSDSDDKSLFTLPQYELISQIKSCSAHGGLAIYLNNRFQYKIFNSAQESTLWEGLFIEVYGGGLKNKVNIGNIYRPPKYNNCNQTINNFMKELQPYINNLEKKAGNSALVGDFNINLLQIKDRPAYAEFFDNLINSSFIPHLTSPTRFSKKSASVIDQIFVNCRNNITTNAEIKSVILSSPISDHLACISHVCDISTNFNPHPKYLQIRKRDEESLNNFKNSLTSSNLLDLCDKTTNANPNRNYNLLHEILQEKMDEFLPCKTIKIKKYRHKKSPWITFGIIKSLKARDKLYKNMIKAPINSIRYTELQLNLHTFNSILRRSIRWAKSNYFHHKLESYKFNIKRTWDVIKDLIHKGKASDYPLFFNVQGKKLSDPKSIADNFNKYFASIVSPHAETTQNMPHTIYTGSNIRMQNLIFSFEPAQNPEISKVIKSLKTKDSTGFDNISTRLLKFINNEISPVLCLIINQSLLTGIFPSKLKIAKIIPIYKKGDNMIFSNYRPVSLLPSISKVFEKIVFKQIISYFTENDLFFDGQYGFRKEHSTEHAVTELVDRIYDNLDSGKLSLAIFLDLSKAFDMLNHKILLAKLQHYGVTGTSLNWFASYLSERKQFVSFQNYNSNYIEITTGVPQGSILGPLLFIIFMNDINFSSNIFNFILFADDTTLSSPIDHFSFENTFKIINEELQKVNDWLQINKLALNVQKSKFMIFHYAQRRFMIEDHVNLKIDNNNISRVNSFNLLGITLDDNLTWNNHLRILSSKISRTNGLMARLKNVVPCTTLRLIYSSLVTCHLNYGVTLWGNNRKRLNIIQKKSIRIITNSKYNAHTEPLFKSLNLLKLDHIYSLQCLKFYYKYINGKLPKFFNSFFPVVQQGRYHTRQSGSRVPVIPISRTASAKNRIRFSIPKLLNTIPDCALDKLYTHSLSGFADYYKKLCLNTYQPYCEIRNCYICSRFEE